MKGIVVECPICKKKRVYSSVESEGSAWTAWERAALGLSIHVKMSHNQSWSLRECKEYVNRTAKEIDLPDEEIKRLEELRWVKEL